MRRFEVADAALLTRLDSDPEVMRFINGGLPTPPLVYRERIMPAWLDLYERGPGVGYWAVERKDDARFVGWVHLRPDRLGLDANELGYRFERASWGLGYATEISRAVIAKAFDVWGDTRIVAHTLVGNLASRRVMEKCGMSLVKTFTLDASVLPGWDEAARAAVLYEIRRSDP